uniref:Macaca fascicularis brain cDNA clone: QflA-16332, similar to human SAC1 suppressor of actin mutations 1-like (yeast)(SACM1L), mRNA, RefSeq: NM_014016.2 n=1 Tax=Macaca fascicularis TaxID=9541 RepID=I7GMA8_MACFA|nr:unnamed protein product [Macaca fascicularis]
MWSGVLLKSLVGCLMTLISLSCQCTSSLDVMREFRYTLSF